MWFKSTEVEAEVTIKKYGGEKMFFVPPSAYDEMRA